MPCSVSTKLSVDAKRQKSRARGTFRTALREAGREECRDGAVASDGSEWLGGTLSPSTLQAREAGRTLSRAAPPRQGFGLPLFLFSAQPALTVWRALAIASEPGGTFSVIVDPAAT